MEKTIVKQFGSATLSYEGGKFLLTGVKDKTVSFSVKPTDKQVRKSIQGMHKA